MCRRAIGARSVSTERSPDQPAELPRSYLRTCLLLLLAESTSHGYEMLEQVHALGINAADTGGLYRELRSMERDTLVQSDWETSSVGPPRRRYWMTATGADALDAAMVRLAGTQGLLTQVIERYHTRSTCGMLSPGDGSG